jgi:uncharacterized protein YjiS (DUF1127 family)
MGILSTIFRGSARRRAFDDLMALDDHLLRDMGIERKDIAATLRARHRTPVARTHE